MQKGNSNYERIILIVMALAALAGGAWFIYARGNFPQTLALRSITPKTYEGVIPVKSLEEATALAAADNKNWTPPVRNNKPVPLFKAVLLVLKSDQQEQPIDMFLEQPQIRPPMTNEWFRKHNLPMVNGVAAYLIPNIGELDADNDGYSNREEFEKGTNPKDADSHPPFTDRLFLVQRVARNYLVALKSSSPPYQVSVTTPDGKKKGWFVEEGKRFGIGDRFIVEKFEKKMVPDPRIGEKDMSELSIVDTLTKKKITLVKDVAVDLAEYEAKLEFRLKGNREPIDVKKGDPFRISIQPDTTYKVIDIQEDNAVISAVNSTTGNTEKEIIIKKG